MSAGPRHSRTTNTDQLGDTVIITSAAPSRTARDGSRGSRTSPLAAIARGLIAGAVGTIAMDTLLFARYKRGGGELSFRAWEFSSGVSGWEDAPAPALVGKRLVEGLSQRELSPDRAALVNNVTHWGYGMFAAAQYGIVAGSLRAPRRRYGLPFGAGVWGASYVMLPALGLYEPIWHYDRKTLAKDLSAHLVYGLGTASAFHALSA
jgi:hypothetical protein